MSLGALTRPELIFPDLPATDRPGVLRALAAISRWIKADGHAGRLLGLHDAARVYDLLRDEDG